MNNGNFVRSSVLEILIPEDQEIDIVEALNSAAESDAEIEGPLWSTVSQRDLLYFDEQLSIFAILKAPYENEDWLKDQLSRLSVAVEAHAISLPTGDSRADMVSPPAGPPARDTIWSTSLDTNEEPISLIVGSDEEGVGKEIILIWKLSAFLSRPRIRLQAPVINFKLSGSLAPPRPSRSADPILPSGVPLPANLLAPLQYDLALQGAAPYFSAQQLGRGDAGTSSAPLGGVPATERPLRVAPRRPLRAIPALGSRLRSHRGSAPSGTADRMMATLDLDVPGFAPHPVTLTEVSVEPSGGLTVRALGEGVCDLPMLCHARDQVVFPYRLSTDLAADSDGPRVLDVRIRARVQLSSKCQPRIEVHWRAHVDLGPIASNPQANAAQPRVPRTSGSTAATEDALADSSQIVLNVLIRAKDPEKRLRVGEPFHWEVLVVNRSTKPRRLGLQTIPKRRPMDGVRPSSRPGSAMLGSFGKPGGTAPAVVDDNVLYATMKAQAVGTTELVRLSADVQVGPLSPGAVASADMELLPLATGLLELEAVRITDLDSGETSDIREHPDIFVEAG